jgi:hypothetical protein
VSIVLVLVGVVAASAGLTNAIRATSNSTPSAAVQDDACAQQIAQFRRKPESANDSLVNRRAHACVDEVDEARRRRSMMRTTPDNMRLAVIHSSIPEYHDEQRLPDGSGGLGPKAAIYASPYLHGFNRQWQYNVHGNEGLLVAHVSVELLPGETIPPTYMALGLSEGLNCVWLTRLGASNNYRATVRPAPNNTECNRTGPGATSLFVKTQSYGGASTDAYPPVARFSISKSGNPLLGVSCLNAWCEIGAPEAGGPFQTYDPLPMELIPSTTENVMRVKAWHDEQLLSVQDPTTRKWLPTNIRAAIVPAEGVGDLQPDRFRSNWIPVATVYLDRDPPTDSKYYDWGLRGGRTGNKIELRVDGANWRVQVTSSAGTKSWRFGHRMEHFDVAVPGTSRFRWTILDDAIWTPCGQACCRVEGY